MPGFLGFGSTVKANCSSLRLKLPAPSTRVCSVSSTNSCDWPMPSFTSKYSAPQFSWMSLSPPTNRVSSLPPLRPAAASMMLEIRPLATAAVTLPLAEPAASAIELPAPCNRTCAPISPTPLAMSGLSGNSWAILMLRKSTFKRERRFFSSRASMAMSDTIRPPAKPNSSGVSCATASFSLNENFMLSTGNPLGALRSAAA